MDFVEKSWRNKIANEIHETATEMSATPGNPGLGRALFSVLESVSEKVRRGEEEDHMVRITGTFEIFVTSGEVKEYAHPNNLVYNHLGSLTVVGEASVNPL